jgi:hypothetical protein
MLQRQEVLLQRDREGAVVPHHFDRSAKWQRLHRWHLDRRAREREGAQHGHAMGRLEARPDQCALRQPADIAVTVELTPRPPFPIVVVDRDALAFQRLGLERGSVRR